jgi:hypothetical protein
MPMIGSVRIVHDFIRTAVRASEHAGISRSVAMKLTGHKTESVYRRHAIVSKSDLEEAVRRLDNLSEKVALNPGDRVATAHSE